MNPLVVIPVFIHKPNHVQLLVNCLESLRNPKTTSAPVDIIMVDDCSPMEGKSELLKDLSERFSTELVEKPVNSGFSKTVNVGLIKAHKRNQTAVLVNMDLQFIDASPDWYQIAEEDPADMLGGLLLYPTGFTQHAGVYYSLLHRYLDHIGRFAPWNMPEIQVRREIPVTGALHIIKPQVMDAIGYYDETFKMAYEDIDYCLRVMLPVECGGAGMKVAYNPRIVAIHHESMVRGGVKKYSDWHDEAWVYFQTKYASAPLGMFIPPIDIERNEDGSPACEFGTVAASNLIRESIEAAKRQSGDSAPVVG